MDNNNNNKVAMEGIQWSDREFGILAGSILFDEDDCVDDNNNTFDESCAAVANDPFGFGVWFPSSTSNNITQQQQQTDESRLVSPTLQLERMMIPQESLVFPPQGSEWNSILNFPEPSSFTPMTNASSPIMEQQHQSAYITASTSSLTALVPNPSSAVHTHKLNPLVAAAAPLPRLIPLSQAPLLPRISISSCSKLSVESASNNNESFVPISPSSSMSSHAGQQSLEQVAAMMNIFAKPMYTTSNNFSTSVPSSAAVSSTDSVMTTSYSSYGDASEADNNNKKRKYSSDPQQDEEMEEKHRRERNRFMAKRTRDKKKKTFSHLQEELMELAQENKMLKGLVQNDALFGETRRRAILDQCNAMQRIPQQVWDACESHVNGVQEEAAATDILDSLTSAWASGNPQTLQNVVAAPTAVTSSSTTTTTPTRIFPKGAVPDPLYHF